MASLKRNVLRLDPECMERLDEIAEQASDILNREVSRAAVVRAAVEERLTKNEHVEPAEFIEVLRMAIVKRGRRPWKHLHYEDLHIDKCSGMDVKTIHRAKASANAMKSSEEVRTSKDDLAPPTLPESSRR